MVVVTSLTPFYFETRQEQQQQKIRFSTRACLLYIIDLITCKHNHNSQLQKSGGVFW